MAANGGTTDIYRHGEQTAKFGHNQPFDLVFQIGVLALI
jgi:hypothetical protein